MAEPELDVAVIGAGFAGMYMLHRLRGLGFRARVFEAGSGVGGTWYWNRYPGARCDIESVQYSYQFDEALQQEWVWSERHATQPEILGYAEHVAERFDLYADIQFDTRIEGLELNAAGTGWTLETEDGACFTARFCVMATGCLSVPNWPALPGLENFAGPVLHTARWPHGAQDFTGRRVAVIGTGSSGIQTIPLVAEQADRLTVFQRTANYTIPARNAPLDPEKVRALKARYKEFRAEAKQTGPGIHAVFRPASVLEASEDEVFERFEERWRDGGLIFMGAFGDLMLTQEGNDKAAGFVRDKIRAIVDDAETAERLCPRNIIGAKRLCVDTDYYATYNRDNVQLVDLRAEPIERVGESSIRTGADDYPADVVIIATGFDAMTGALTNVDIRGRDGVRLAELWDEGPSSYLGLAMNGFPNLFTVTGPGSPSVFTNMIPTIEQHVDWIADCLVHARDHRHGRIEATGDAEQAWWAHVQEVGRVGLKATVDSWYVGANVEGKARVFLPYLGGFPEYCRKCEEVVARDYEGFAFG